MVVFVPFPHWQLAGGKSNSTASDISAWPIGMGGGSVGGLTLLGKEGAHTGFGARYYTFM